MKVLLIIPPNENIIASHVPEYVSNELRHLPPLGLLYIATYLDENSAHSVEIYDALIHKASYDQVAQKTLGCDIVGITTLTFLLPDVVETVKAIRRVNPSIPVVLGGPHIAIYPEETVQMPGVTFCLKGECDRTFTQLVELLAQGSGDYQSIPGLYWLEEDRVRSNAVDDFIMDLDRLPVPNRSLLEYKRYSSILSQCDFGQRYVTTAFSSRGCPYKCIFCDRPHLGKKFRAHSANRVVEEVQQCAELGIGEVFFYDDTFTINRERVYEICDLILERGIVFKWDIRARVDTVDYNMLKLMERAGCARIHFGVEAGNPEILKVLKKGITLKQAAEAFKMAREAGIETLAYFMFGCPGETLSQMQETLDFALKIDPDYAHFGILTPFPGTPLYLDALRRGWFENDYWRDFARSADTNFRPRFLPNTLPQEQLVDVLKRAYKTFYIRPRTLLRQVRKIRSWENFVTKVNMAKRICIG